MDKQQNIDFVLRTVEERDIRFVRLWFTDVLGRLKSFAISPEDLEVAFEDGIGFDGSSIEGFTTPEEAARFVEATGVDALAVAIGSAHGFYKQAPRLDIERLAQIHAATDAALVLHGSSGIPHDMVREAIANGIVKVNLATEIKDNFMRALKGVLLESEEIDLRKVFPKAVAPVVELLCEKYRMVGSSKVK